MYALTFDAWWAEFLGERRHDKDGGFDAAADLAHYVDGLSSQQRVSFLCELVHLASRRREGWGLATAVLADLANDETCELLWQESQEQLADGPEEWRVAVLRVLARSPNGSGYELVRRFLLSDPIGTYWSALPWACSATDPDLFIAAWARYFSTVDASMWQRTAIPQAFLRHGHELEALKHRLLIDAPNAWLCLHDDLARQRDAPWLSRPERDALAAVLA